MTMAISKAVERGAKVVICASTGNTSASAAAYAARAGLMCAVVIPQGQIALGQARAGADPRRAAWSRCTATSTDALEIVRELGERPGVDGRQLGQPVPHRGPEDRRVRDRRRARRRARRALHPGRQRRQHHRLLAGLLRVRAPRVAPTRTPRMLGWQARARRRSCAASRCCTPRRSPPRSRSATRRRWDGRDRARATSRAGTSARSPTPRSSRPTAMLAVDRGRASSSRRRRRRSPGCCKAAADGLRRRATTSWCAR